jgi:hypothetical protein
MALLSIMQSQANVCFWHKADIAMARFGNFAAQNNSISAFSSSLLGVRVEVTRTVLE